MGFLYYADQYYWLLVVPAFLISLIAQLIVSVTFSKYSKVKASGGITANRVAEAILKGNEIYHVKIERVRGNLTDHYDPRSHVIRLSDTVNNSSSMAAIGVAAHEAGHAIQHEKKYAPVLIRQALVPIANIGSQAGIFLAFLGLLLGFVNLTYLGIFLFTGAVLFYLITLPVEINASRRAVAILSNMGSFNDYEIKAVKKVLTAAALTYVAAVFTSLANLLRLILLARDSSRRR